MELDHIFHSCMTSAWCLHILEMNMTAYVLLILVSISASLLTVWLHRLISGWRKSRAKMDYQPAGSMVSLSNGSGQWQARHQQGFVQSNQGDSTPARAASRDSKSAGKGPLRKPWGW